MPVLARDIFNVCLNYRFDRTAAAAVKKEVLGLTRIGSCRPRGDRFKVTHAMSAAYSCESMLGRSVRFFVWSADWLVPYRRHTLVTFLLGSNKKL